jgi:hypothetical protein
MKPKSTIRNPKSAIKLKRRISMKNTLPLITLLILLTASCTPKGKCTYRGVSDSIQLEWTAYKTSEKVPVQGKFGVSNLTGPMTGGNLNELLTGLKLEIDSGSLLTGDAGRDVTIKQFFFDKFNPADKINASVASLAGDDQKGVLHVTIEMNGVTKTIPFAYQVSSEGMLEAKATIQLFDFNLQEAFASLHQACEDKHTGKDGVSKTWDTVDLLLMGKFSKECS